MHAFRPAIALAIMLFIALKIYAQVPQREKIYIHFDKPYYFTGETCWFKAYMVQASDLLPTESSGILYVDWITPDGKILKHQKLKISEGEATGDFSFGTTVPAGEYYLRAYTNFLRNFNQEFFFSRTFMVYNSENLKSNTSPAASKEIDLQFFPEGGTAVNGLQSQVAFKAIDAYGNGTDVNGKIVDGKGNEVAILKSMHRGMGVFPYIPSMENYRVVLDNGQVFDLPKAAVSGVVMSVNNMHPEKILVQIRASRSISLSNYTLVGRLGNEFAFSKPIEGDRSRANLEISRKDLRGGVLQLSLFDAENIPRAERIVFIDNKKLMNIRLESDSILRRDDSVSFVIHAKDDVGNPVQTYLSLAISDADYVSVDSLGDNISTHFLFQSDIKGKIEEPAWYFKTNNSRNIYALDLVMLTHGWRRYDSVASLKYKPEFMLSMNGRVVSKGSGKPVANANLTLMLTGMDYSGVYVTTSDGFGKFSIEGIDFSDSTNLVWQVKNEKGKMVDADIVLDDSSDVPEVNIVAKEIPNKIYSTQNEAKILKAVRDFSNLGRVEVLKEVEVVGGRTQSRPIGVDSRLIKPGKEDYHLFGSSFISRYAPVLPFMVQTMNAQGNLVWRLPSGKPVRFVINGYLMDEEIGDAGNPYLLLNAYRTDQIDYVVVNGTARKGYFIVIKTKTPPPAPKIGIVKLKAPGYQWTRTFYEPRYGGTTQAERTTTVFWEPYLETDETGTAVVRLPTQDIRKKLVISAEGISNGSPGSLTTELHLP